MKNTLPQESVASSLPISTDGIREFLVSPGVDGIGPVYARRLTDEFGRDTLRILIEEPWKAEQIAGLGSARITAASDSLKRLPYPADLTAFLFSCGVGDMFIGRIFGKYRKRTREVVTTDPYAMVEDVWRLSFFTADKIGKALEIPDDDPRRLRGALLTAVKHFAENGHLFATVDQAINLAANLAGVKPEIIGPVINSLLEDGRLVKSRGGLYIPVYYQAEKNAADRLKALAASDSKVLDVPAIPVTAINGHEYSDEQKGAIKMALENPVMVLTGGPGSGKTTVLKGILDIFDQKGLKVILAAPTGRAAKRMTTLTGREASTIHRLLGYRSGEGYFNKKIDTDVLVIDEGSMMEQVLFDHLLEAVRTGTRIILVGDVNQLPAIGAGDVMRDMINSGNIAVAQLNGNFRQEAGSGIAAGANAINHGEMPDLNEDEDLLLFEEKGVKAIHDKILKLVAEELPDRFNIFPMNIRVVTPQQMGPLGARALNLDIQNRLNGNSPGIKRGLTTFRLGDPVMQTANSHERRLYNGETGRIVEIDPEERFLVVDYGEGRRSVYQRSELSELVLAYATTVHKLQGSEVDYMVMPISMAHRPMLYRNLIYTGISRARRLCAIVGEVDAIRFAIDNNPNSTRNSNFAKRLRPQS